MRIALFTDTYLPDINGVAVSTRTLARVLRKHGHDVLVVTTSKPKKSSYVDDEKVLRIPGIDIKKLYGYRASSFYSTSAFKEIKAFDPEIIHVQQEFGVSSFGRITAAKLSVPLVYTYHTMYEDYTYYLSKNIKMLDKAWKSVAINLSKKLGNDCTHLIVPSEKTAHILKKYGIENDISIIGTGLELDRFDIKNVDSKKLEEVKKTYGIKDTFNLIYLGRLAKEKSIDLIIECLSQAVKTNPNIRLLIVGGGPEEPELRELVKTLNVEKYVFFAGPQPSSEVPVFYHASNVFVGASLTETQGLTYIEAMASSLPVIARYDENLEPVIKHGRNGYFFKEKDELISLIIKMSAMDLTQISTDALEDSQAFSSETFYEHIMIAYDKALKKSVYNYKITDVSKDEHGYAVTYTYGIGHKGMIHVGQDEIEWYNLRVGETFDQEQMYALKDIDQVREAYNKALKYLSYKDYTYEMMKEKLVHNGNYSELQIDMTMNLLLQKGLINDRQYAHDYLTISLKKGHGLNRGVVDLKKKGVDPVLIDEVLLDFSDDMELEKAVEIVKILYEKNNSRSPKALMLNMKQKLFNKGFSEQTINKAIESVDFEFPSEHTKILLEKEYHKVYTRYSQKYSGSLLKTKIITFLLQKGYEYDDIVQLIQEVWRDDIED